MIFDTKMGPNMENVVCLFTKYLVNVAMRTEKGGDILQHLYLYFYIIENILE